MCNGLFERLRTLYCQFNLFDDDSTNAIVIKNQRIATRIYLFSMVILLLLVGLVALTMERSNTGYISSPTEITFRRLSSAYSSTLHCPCHDISILYQSFAYIQYHLHQVCSSAFITDDWIRSISTDSDHLEMSFFWQIIARFCRLSQISIETTIDQFYVTHLISAMAIDHDFILIQAQAAFDTLLSNSRSLFFRNLMAIQRVTAGNQFVSALGTNANVRWTTVNGELLPMLFSRTFENCSCLNLDGCPRSSIEGIVSDCFMINGVLQSSFQCYFNQTCLSQLHPGIASSINILNPENNHLSLMNSTVEDLFNKFLLDQLSIQLDFTRYYQQCQPNFCSYSYRQRFDFAYTVTLIIGIFGGLNIILRLLCPLIVKKTLSWRVVPTQVSISLQHRPSLLIRINSIRSMAWQSICSLNLFKNRFANEESLQQERLNTRVFILLITITVIVSGVYVFFSIQTQVITISHPSLDVYHKLYHNFSRTLSCPCSQMSILYKKFLRINYTLHQVCASTLVSSSWLKFILAYNRPQSLYAYDIIIDFRLLASSYFQLLATACSLVQNTFDYALNSLKESHYINQYVPSQSKFLEQMSLVNQSLTVSIQQEFLIIQNWLHLQTTKSQILIGLGINGRLTSNNDSNIVEITDTHFSRFMEVTETTYASTTTCSCRQLPTFCQIIPVLHEVNGTQPYSWRYFVGMNAGCIPWLGLLLTDTNWWYRADIIEQIRLLLGDHLHNQSNPIINPLKNHTETRFRHQNGSYPLFEGIFKEALVERWTGDLTRFDLFYQECAPKECTYLIESQRSRLAAFLLLISICGGLNQILRWFSLLFFNAIFYMKDRYRHRLDQGQWNIVGHIRRSVFEWNLFRSTSVDIVRIHRERLQTRFYIGILTVSISILIVYTSLIERAIVEMINPPSNSTEYAHYRQIYPATLECPCSGISLQYNTIIPKLEVESFHPICDSSFVTPDWINFLVGDEYDPSALSNEDFNQWIIPIFELLITFCSLARDQLSYTLSTFLSSSMIVNRLISAEQFEQQLNTTVLNIQQRILAEFLQILDLIRLNQQGNALISVFSSNWQYHVRNNNRSMGALLSSEPVTYENDTCSCALSSQRCSKPASLLTPNGNVYYTLDGFVLGCTVLDSFLQSSFKCFYSVRCIDSLALALAVGRYDFYPRVWNASGLFNPINHSLSIFDEDDTIETIINRMFINRWRNELSYEAFFQGCAVRDCTYTRHYRFDALNVITTFLSVFGGLSVVLRFLVPHLFTVMNKIFS